MALNHGYHFLMISLLIVALFKPYFALSFEYNQ